MLIRYHKVSDLADITRLFYDTIHQVNARDYTREQIDAWAPSVPEVSFWKQRSKNYRIYVAEEDARIVGFTELGSTGHIDCFFVHHQWQRRGVGSGLMERVLATAHKQRMPRLYAEVSITAEPFFRSRGFVVVKESEAIRHNVKLKQFAMERWLKS